MAVPVLPYTMKYYNFLPKLHEAKCQFEFTRASEVLFTKIENAFIKHHVEELLEVALLHNHFLLEPHDMLMNTRSGTKALRAVNASA